MEGQSDQDIPLFSAIEMCLLIMLGHEDCMFSTQQQLDLKRSTVGFCLMLVCGMMHHDSTIVK